MRIDGVEVKDGGRVLILSPGVFATVEHHSIWMPHETVKSLTVDGKWKAEVTSASLQFFSGHGALSWFDTGWTVWRGKWYARN